ncbi:MULTISPECIES: anaerobic ribonucleoside-triphosphate reductase [Desulfovibrio]|uniref:Anaerobic ribonucleoside-triphosphate reductase n=1 Tax=Desulfovibrio desulfuricans TaxID=876 RepID=A0AA94HVI8_DESDE|nr:anaerobic ribonucleoside-triphosphate reductase [Desulfovibrio desulfuricans]SFW75158.1 Anaerobic ribonucleoside-triphosphate reductase [Desulfovibrio desulfuricans]SPD34987.1 ribonucleoside-triphosphate reductase [Desulfovibrio sp. G11]SPD36567.1 ribonucleoside-triphosphate reductase [Desulfovibrio sp. G11]
MTDAIANRETRTAMPHLVGVGMKFDRTRRITGYLVGDLERFNNAKRAEERDRVKHGT